ncbi:hypothetical protein SDRG_02182 [Saprolegnia diclina VS20]|uniref:Uncharacterized protein n=1 Tax=Saprolegnia diclina (strain VS20) TaxID=1156394 RepID=T0S562_SAPDV|nr:hypothetical protein SDRG_02182 [Saprolegnia diclina VS20]EQC40278.1 hypothetical protein SDRG_02182 [Saprolegnia diclina VS20]|eukprot:XP_008605977.1 hypothetical protein SDRG_02182 [Saprolegnia diclina VS20]
MPRAVPRNERRIRHCSLKMNPIRDPDLIRVVVSFQEGLPRDLVCLRSCTPSATELELWPTARLLQHLQRVQRHVGPYLARDRLERAMTHLPHLPAHVLYAAVYFGLHDVVRDLCDICVVTPRLLDLATWQHHTSIQRLLKTKLGHSAATTTYGRISQDVRALSAIPAFASAWQCYD